MQMTKEFFTGSDTNFTMVSSWFHNANTPRCVWDGNFWWGGNGRILYNFLMVKLLSDWTCMPLISFSLFPRIISVLIQFSIILYFAIFSNKCSGYCKTTLHRALKKLTISWVSEEIFIILQDFHTIVIFPLYSNDRRGQKSWGFKY